MAEIAQRAYRSSDLPESRLREMYELMLLTRLFDAQAVSLQRQGRIGFYVPSEGEEAAEVGSILAMGPDDWIFPDYRASGVMIGRGMSLDLLLAQLMANSSDSSKGRSMPSHWGNRALNIVHPSSPLCTQLPHAVGVGLGAKMRGEKVCAIGYFGDGGTSSNDFHSAMNFAAVFKTPTIFFCRNNGYAISVPLNRQTATPSLVVKADAYAMEGVQVDGNDVLAVYAATKKAVEKARSGGGPTFIEAVTYRLGPHSTSDDPTKYRTVEELALWQRRDPITRFRKYLMRKEMLTEAEDRALQESAENEIISTIKESEKIPAPTPLTMFTDVYAEMPWHLKEEAEEAEREGG